MGRRYTKDISLNLEIASFRIVIQRINISLITFPIQFFGIVQNILAYASSEPLHHTRKRTKAFTGKRSQKIQCNKPNISEGNSNNKHFEPAEYSQRHSSEIFSISNIEIPEQMETREKFFSQGSAQPNQRMSHDYNKVRQRRTQN